MYEELVTKLRHWAASGHSDGRLYFLAYDLDKAANVIEELNRKVEDFESMREISPEAEYAINKHADSIISKLDKLISDSEDKPRWIPVSERLPEEKEASYLCLTDEGYCVEVRWTNLHVFTVPDKWGWNILDIPYYARCITHWMPLPELPKEEIE